MAITRDAAAHPPGTTGARAQWAFDAGHDTYARWGSDYSAKTAAACKRWAGQHIPVQPSDCPDGTWWVRIERGTWQDSSFDDTGYGWVTDVEWVRDDSYEVVGFVVQHADGDLPGITWEDWS